MASPDGVAALGPAPGVACPGAVPRALGFMVAPEPQQWVGCAAHWPCTPHPYDPSLVLYTRPDPDPDDPQPPEDDLPF